MESESADTFFASSVYTPKKSTDVERVFS